jgi:WhiB family transcriptional regulator, redox-sensing transcriptional regulator
MFTNTPSREWIEKAECRKPEHDTNTFFPERGSNTIPAKRICYDCPVRAECAEYAIALSERIGVWGGLSERDRRKIRRIRSLARKNGLVNKNYEEDDEYEEEDDETWDDQQH